MVENQSKHALIISGFGGIVKPQKYQQLTNRHYLIKS